TPVKIGEQIETICSFIGAYDWLWESDGSLHIVYQYYDNQLGSGCSSFSSPVFHRTNRSGTWVESLVTGRNSQNLTVAMGPDDELHVSFGIGTSNPRYWFHKDFTAATPTWENEGNAYWDGQAGYLVQGEDGQAYFIDRYAPSFDEAAVYRWG